ncbi:MAG: ribonuclease D [Pseudomonadota bacterium]
MNYLIDQQEQLDQLFARANKAKVVGVDTEFLREKTYYAKLCLIQLGIGDDQFCIDVLQIEDLSVVAQIFRDPTILKIFHAASQDLEVLYQFFGELPEPVYDTQLAAAFCGADLQLGYGAIVEEMLDIKLDKDQARTDWSKRPLSDAQLAYAADDVAYLEPLYALTSDKLESQSKTSWYAEDLAVLANADQYKFEVDEAYHRLSGGALRVTEQYRLQALATWREQTAQQRDIPRTWVIKDRAMYDIAVKYPRSPSALLDMGLLGRKSGPYMAPKIVNLLRQASSGIDKNSKPIWRRVEPLSKPQKQFCSGLMQKTADIAENENIAQALLGTRKTIESLFRHKQSDKLLSGWRTDVIGKPLLAQIEANDAL